MAQLTPEQCEHIESTTKIAIDRMEEKLGTILLRGEAMQNTIAGIEKHSRVGAELRSSHRAGGEGDQVEPRPCRLHLED